MALTDEQIRSPAFEKKLGVLAPMVATMEVAGRLGLPGSQYGSGYSTVVPNVGGPGAILDYFYAGGPFQTIRQDVQRGDPLASLKSFLGIVGTGAAAIFAPALAPAITKFSSALTATPRVPAITSTLRDIAPVAVSPVGGPVMWEDIFDDVSGFFDTSGMEVDWGGLLDTGVSFATNLMQPSSYQSYAVPVANSGVPAVRGSAPTIAARAAAAGLPKWAASFPALYQFIVTKGLPTGAINSLLSMLTKWGPAALTGLWGAAVVTDLMSYKATRKRRRMNPANAKALRRAARRIKSFHRLCGHADLIKTRRRGSSCGTCKRSPCRCR